MSRLVNKVNTPITDELLIKLSPEYRSEFYELIDQISFLCNIISPKRRYIKDMPKDKNGRVIVDFENPHILENMDYFRQPAIHFQKFGCYTKAFPNKSRGSDYYRFWEQEKDRCINGMQREDGEFVSGYFYFYLNYCMITRPIKQPNGKIELGEAFPDVFDGDYFYFNYIEQCELQGKHACVLKARRRGFSWKSGAMGCRNYHLIPKSKSYYVAHSKEFLIADGVMSKAWVINSFVNLNTEFGKQSQSIDRPMHKRASYKEQDTGVETGYMSEMMGITTQDDLDKVRGKSGTIMFLEEAGVNPNLKKIYDVAKPSYAQGHTTYGLIAMYGTGGTEGSDFEGLLEFFRDPAIYGLLPMKDVFSKGDNSSSCGYFSPEYISREGFYDKDGNSDAIGALVEVLQERDILRRAPDRNSIIRAKAESPLTPSEAIMKVEGNFFPAYDIREYLAEIEPNLERFTAKHQVGNMVVDPNGNTGFMIADKYPLREYPIKRDSNKAGAVELFEMPDKSNYKGYRYIAGIDPIDDDYAMFSDSLGSIMVFDRLKRRIVAEYTGRPQTANEFYEICLRLLKYYQAVGNYENNKKGLFTYFNNKNCLQYLCDVPETLKDRQMIKDRGAYGNKAKGTNANKEINEWGRRLQHDWMMEKAYEEDGEDKGRLNLHTIRSLGYL